MKNLEQFIHLCEAYVNDSTIPNIRLSGFEIIGRTLRYDKHFCQIIFTVHCTRFALNWLRLNLGYLPEKHTAKAANDCNIELNYSIALNAKNIETLKTLNSHCRDNWNQLISLGGNSTDYARYISESTKERKKIKQQIAYDSLVSSYSQRLNEIDKMYRKLQNDKKQGHGKYQRYILAHNRNKS